MFESVDIEQLKGGMDRYLTRNRIRTKKLLEDRHLDAQLTAIKALLDRNRDDERLASEKIKNLDDEINADDGDCPEYTQYMSDHWVDTLFGTFFQDAAHSMSAVGMLAPFLEWLFHSVYEGLGKRLGKYEVDENPRSKLTEDKYWNPKIFARNNGAEKRDLAIGIKQLAESIGLHPYLPEGYQKTLQALFAYRNCMFHGGFEWTPKKRQEFFKWNNDGRWPAKWFKHSKRGEDPWIFYMSDEFVEHCVNMIDLLLDGVERYLKEKHPRIK